MNTISTSVVICGAGPVGLTLAHLLGSDGIDCIVLDRLEGIVTEPRAIAIDGESLRTLQKLKLLDGIQHEFLCGLIADYVNGSGEQLFRIGRPDFRPYGYALINSFDQPTLDRYLADKLKDRDSVQLRFNHVLTGFEQDDSCIRVFCTNDATDDLAGMGDRELEIRAQYLVGCDGGRSTVRSLLNIAMRGENNPQPWLVIDTKDAHLDGQLDCRFYCDPKRPGMTIRKSRGERRWEWMLMPGEERDFLLDDETIRGLLAPYTNVDQVQVYRKKVYDFHALIAERWREGRVLLAGDAAHMTPPFAGQGLNSGLRDVTNLSWKLAMVVKGHASPAILDSYEKDRRDHAWELIETAVTLGNQIQPIDAAHAAERDAVFAELNKDPAGMEGLETEMLKSVTERHVDKSFVVASEGSELAGRLLIQPLLKSAARQVMLDDCLGAGFAILAVDCDPVEFLSEEMRQQWLAMGCSFVRIHTGNVPPHDDSLCDERSVFRRWLGSDEPMLLLVRPDRFCMASARPADVERCLGRAYALIARGQ